MQSELFNFDINGLSVEDIVFSQISANKPLKGNYIFLINLYGVNSNNEIYESKMILGGKAFGIMGTDELRRGFSHRIALGNAPCIVYWSCSGNCISSNGITLWSLCGIQR